MGGSPSSADIQARWVRDGANAAYAAYEDYAAASVLDSGWALASELRTLTSAQQTQLFSWLIAQQQPDGSFQINGTPSIAATAAVLRGLKDAASQNAQAASMARTASSYLLAQQTPQGHWQSDVAATAMAFEAVHPYTDPQGTTASRTQTYLLSQQRSDGSWSWDPYISALALRALALTSVPPISPVLHGATLKGVATNATNGQALAGVLITATLPDNSTKQATTNAQGSYEFQVPAGTVTLRASLAGYQTLQAQGNAVEGNVIWFSPALYPDNTPVPSGGQIAGTTVALGTQGPLAGVTARLQSTAGALIATTSSLQNGSFALQAAAGDYQLIFSLAGYESVTNRIMLTDGSQLNMGAVTLRPARQTSSLSGRILDAQGQPIEGAQINLSGPSISGTNSTESAAGGRYQFNDLNGTEFTVRISADSYISTNTTLRITQPGDVVQDFVLAGTNTPALTLSDLSASPTTAGLNQNIRTQARIHNPSSQEANAAIVLTVSASDGRQIAKLSAQDMVGLPLTQLTLQPGEQRDVQFQWNTAAHPPGAYGLTAVLYVPGTATSENPEGERYGALSTGMHILPEAHFTGSVTANPPVLRANTSTAVALSAMLQNDGNIPLPAQTYVLRAINTSTNATSFETSVTGEALLQSRLQPLDFGTWTPSDAGDYRLELTSEGVASSQVIGKLFVGDAGQATYTVNRPRVPAGTQTVRASVKVTGQDATGAISDPLAPLIKQAITKTVNYADNYAFNHYVTDLKCYACHVQTQSIVGGERNLRFAPPLDPVKRSALLSSITQSVQNDGSITDSGVPMVNTSLALWAVSEWHDPAAVDYPRTQMADYVMQRQQGNGSWPFDHIYSWWRTPSPLVALNLGSLADLKRRLTTAPPVQQPAWNRVDIPGLPAGDMRFAVSPTGELYVSIRDRSELWKVSTQGTPTLLESNLRVNNVRYLPDGRWLLSTETGVYIRDTAGTMLQLTPQECEDAQPYGSGQYLIYPRGYEGKVLVLDAATGTSQPVFTSDLLQTLWGPPNPAVLDVQADGTVIASSYYGTRVLRFNPVNGGLKDIPIPLSNGAPNYFAPYRDGYLLSTDNGLFFYNKDWVAQRWSSEPVSGIVSMPDGRLLVTSRGQIYELQEIPLDADAFNARIDASINLASQWLVTSDEIDPIDNIDVAFQLYGLGKAKAYYADTARANEFDSLIQELAERLRARQRSDGGWGWKEGLPDPGSDRSVSDSMITAMVGIALDSLNPSPNSPEVRNAIHFLLSNQQPDGTWASESGAALVYPTIPGLISSTWVEIWLPTMLDRLGGIDTDVQLDFAPNVTLSNPSLPATSVQTQPDGTSRYTWKLIGVTDAGRTIDFDLTLGDMGEEETRPASTQANLIFGNSFTAGDVTAPIAIPDITSSANLDVSVRTDKPIYSEAEQATFTATILSAANIERNAQVRFTVLDATDTVVQTLPLGPSVTVPALTNTPTSATWSTADLLSGSYRVRAELINAQGTAYASATADFSIQASQAQRNSARVRTDRTSYTTGQTVQITSQLSNLTQNTVQDNVQVQTTVFNSNNQAVWSRSETIAQLTPAAQREYKYSLAAATLPIGSYTVREQLLDAQNRLLAQDSTPFSVQADPSGQNLNGQISASPHALLVGSTIQFTASVTNRGNTPMTNLPVTVQVVDIEQNTILAQFAQTLSIPVGASQPLQPIQWATQGRADATHLVILSANISGTTIALAQDNLRLNDPAVDPGIDPNPGPGPGPNPAPAPNPRGIPWGNPWLLALLMALTSGFALRQRRR